MTSHKSGRKRKRHRSRRRKIRLMLLLAGTLLTAILVVCSIALAKDIRATKTLLDSAKYDLTTAVGLAKNADFARSKAYFEKAEIDFSKARKSLGRPGLKTASSLPVISQNIDAIATLASTGVEVARTGQSLSLAAMQLSTKDGKFDFGINNSRIAVPPLIEAQPYADKAYAHALAAIAESRNIPQSTFLLPPVGSAVQELDEQLVKLKKITETGSKMLNVLPNILGVKEERHYFLAVQNSAELRATGGLIGNYGILTVKNGRFSLGEFNEISALKRANYKLVSAPSDFINRYSQFKGTSMWQNVNMSPDFPTVSRVLLNMYESTTGEHLDGVISIDPVGLQYLLEAIGPVQVQEIATTIYAGNVVHWTLIDAYDVFRNRRERKDSLSDVARAVWDRLLIGQTSGRSKLITQLASAFDEKRMMFYSVNKNEQRVFEDVGYAGALTPTAGDYLQVIMQNHGANKIDVYLHENINYTVSLRADGSASAKLTVKLTNNAPEFGLPPEVVGPSPLSAKGGSSRTYLSIYVPNDAQLMDITVDGKPGLPEINHEKNKTVFSEYLEIEPGASNVASFTYDLPKVLKFNGKSAEYVLDCQTQPVVNSPTITLNVKPPKGTNIIGLPSGSKKQTGEINLNKTLTKDERFTFSLSDD